MAMAPENETDEPKDGQSADMPEAEAEIVDADFTDATGSEKSEAGAEGASSATGPARLRLFGIVSPFSPGVTLFSAFAALVVVAILVFLVWRAQTGPAEESAPSEAAETSPIKQSAQEGSPADAAAAEPAADASKITNAIPADAKTAAVGAAAIDPEKAPASARGLPPPPPAGSLNTELQQAAKEALRASDADQGDAIDLGPAPKEPEIKFESQRVVPPGKEDAEPIASGAESSRTEAKAANPFSTPPEPAAPPSSEVDVAALRQSFERALAEREARANAEIADLRSRLDKIQMSSGSLPDSRASAAAIAFVNLERAAASGGPYADELDNFARLKPESALANRLRASAAHGAPTLAQLKTDFDATARAALAAAARERATGWLSGVLARLPQLISIRPARPQAGSKPAQVVSRAEGALGREDLAAAVSELGVLQGAAAFEFARWIAGARARLEVDETLASLNGALMSELQN